MSSSASNYSRSSKRLMVIKVNKSKNEQVDIDVYAIKARGSRGDSTDAE